VLTLLRIAPFRNAFLFRGVFVWLTVRMAAGIAEVADPNVLQEVWILAIVGVGVLLDARRRGEDLFLGNLGVPPVTIALLGVPGALVLELLFP